MGLLDKFRRRDGGTDFRQPENAIAPDEDGGTSMYEKIDNPELEGGVPDVQPAGGSSKSPQQIALFGTAILGAGIAIAGLMVWANRPTTPDEGIKKEQLEISGNRGYDFAADQARLKAEMENTAASEADMPEAASDVETVPPPEAAAAEPLPSAEPPPKDRRLQGNVLALEAGGSGVQPENETAEGITGGLDDAERAGLQAGGGFTVRLNPSDTPSVRATRRPDSDYLLAKGTHIPCVLQTKIVTTQPGFTRCIAEKDVYSANGKVLLLERGTKITGEQTATLLQGQARIFVLWNEAETPYGVRVPLASSAAGQLGEAGIGVRVNRHFWQRFGGAIMISMIGDLGDYAANRRNRHGGSGQTFNFDGTSESAQDMATEALRNSINIPPTGYANQGSRINIIVARDVDFSGVYERIEAAAAQ